MRRQGKLSGRSSEPVLVVGTTPDYVAKIYGKRRGSVLFLVDDRFKGDAHFTDVPSSDLLFVPLENFEETYKRTSLFLSTDNTAPRGIACFDCESLLTASRLAFLFKKRFAPWQAIARSRNKFEARRSWVSAGIASPDAVVAGNVEKTLEFLDTHGDDIVLKPLSGSGSELLFHCKSELEVREAVRVMEEELPRRKANPLFQPLADPFGSSEVDPCRSWIAEEFVAGEEFSCDFILQDGEIVLIRETGKMKDSDQPFGSVLAYTFPPLYPTAFNKDDLLEVLLMGVRALGYDWGYFMVDYVIRDGLPVLIEITPRPGGDAIPDLVMAAVGRDTLEIYLDFVTGNRPHLDAISLSPEAFASINLYAPKEGTISNIDGSKIRALPEVKLLFLKKSKGARVILPPRDYDNRLLGYCVLKLNPHSNLLSERRRIENLLDLSIREEAA